MKYVVIGASAAGINTVKKLRERDPDAEILMVSKDEHIYSRCILYHYLEGSRTLEELNFAGLDFINKMRITWIKGVEVIGIDVKGNTIFLEGGKKIGYDKLCIATGSHTNFPPIPGLREGKNVVGFRSLSDAEEIMRRLSNVERIFIMGAGLIGMDVAAGLLPYHKQISIADMGPYMMPIQLDESAAKAYQDLFAAEGVKQYYNMGAEEFVLDEEGNCCKVILQDGTEIPVELVINCAGVRANVDFLKDSGIVCDRFGLVVDEYGRTNIENVYGAGDVTGRKPIWPVAVKEGITAACHMSGKEKVMEEYFTLKSSLHFLGLPTVSIGNVNQYDGTYKEEIYKDKEGNYRKIVTKNNVIAGALLQGDLSDSGALAECVRQKKSIFDYRKEMTAHNGI